MQLGCVFSFLFALKDKAGLKPALEYRNSPVGEWITSTAYTKGKRCCKIATLRYIFVRVKKERNAFHERYFKGNGVWYFVACKTETCQVV